MVNSCADASFSRSCGQLVVGFLKRIPMTLPFSHDFQHSQNIP